MKWQALSSRHKLAAGFAILGFVVAAAILLFSWYQNTHGFRYDLTEVALILCPPSFGLMAADHGGLIVQLFLSLLVAIENAALYGLVGLGFGKLLSRSGR